jgi:hypothetical protein
VLGYVQNKGWRGPADVVQSYQGLEKLRGVPQERLLALPDGTDPAAWGPIYDKLGRPQDAAGYQLEVPEGNDGEFAKAAAAQMHQLGLTKTQGETLAKWWNAEQARMLGAIMEERSNSNKQEAEALTREWGAAHEKNLQVARNAAKAFGADEEIINAMQEQIGYAKTLKFFQQIGAKMGEADFVDGQGQDLSGAMSPAQAKAEIATLKADNVWVDRLLAGGQEENRRMQQLIRWASGGA